MYLRILVFDLCGLVTITTVTIRISCFQFLKKLSITYYHTLVATTSMQHALIIHDGVT